MGAEPNAALAAKELPTLDDIVGPDPPAGAVDILDAGAGSMPGGEATDLTAPEPDLVPVVAECVEPPRVPSQSLFACTHSPGCL